MCDNPTKLRQFFFFLLRGIERERERCPSRSANLDATLSALNLRLLVAILFRYLVNVPYCRLNPLLIHVHGIQKRVALITLIQS